jgi:hypothetical protein
MVKKNHLWEDQWFGSCSLAIQFWNLYSIVNDIGKTLKEAWDGTNLKFTFRRTVDRSTLNQWHQLIQIASSIQQSRMRMPLYGSLTQKENILSNLYMLLSISGELNRCRHLLCGKHLSLQGCTYSCGCWLITKH